MAEKADAYIMGRQESHVQERKESSLVKQPSLAQAVDYVRTPTIFITNQIFSFILCQNADFIKKEL